jgi:hypothetical protein
MGDAMGRKLILLGVVAAIMLCFAGCGGNVAMETEKPVGESNSSIPVVETNEKGGNSMTLTDEDWALNREYRKLEYIEYSAAEGEHSPNDITAIYLKYYTAGLKEAGKIFDLGKKVFYDDTIDFVDTSSGNYVLNDKDVETVMKIFEENNVLSWQIEDGANMSEPGSWFMSIEFTDQSQLRLLGKGLEESTYPPEFSNFYQEIEAFVEELRNRDQESK